MNTCNSCKFWEGSEIEKIITGLCDKINERIEVPVNIFSRRQVKRWQSESSRNTETCILVETEYPELIEIVAPITLLLTLPDFGCTLWEEGKFEIWLEETDPVKA